MLMSNSEQALTGPQNKGGHRPPEATLPKQGGFITQEPEPQGFHLAPRQWKQSSTGIPAYYRIPYTGVPLVLRIEAPLRPSFEGSQQALTLLEETPRYRAAEIKSVTAF